MLHFELMIVLSMGCSFWFLIKFLYIQLTSFIIEHFLHFFSAWYSYSLNFVLPIFTNRLCTKNIKNWAFLSPYTTHSLILDFFYAHRARLAVLGCLEKYLFTLFCFELRKSQKSNCETTRKPYANLTKPIIGVYGSRKPHANHTQNSRKPHTNLL